MKPEKISLFLKLLLLVISIIIGIVFALSSFLYMTPDIGACSAANPCPELSFTPKGKCGDSKGKEDGKCGEGKCGKPSVTHNLSETDFALSKMKKAKVVFNSPSKIQLGETRTIRLLLSLVHPVKELKSEFKPTEELSESSAKVSNRMEARLSGQGFNILAITSETQAISANNITEWKWDVVPRTTGSHKIHVTLTAFLTVDGKETPRTVRTLDHEISVEVTPINRVAGFIQNNWQWLWTTLLIPVAGWLWKKYRDKQKNRPIEF